MAETPKTPVLSVVDYDAWNRGYMPPSEHILIDQLAYRGARVKLASDWGEQGAIWIVVRGDKNWTRAVRKATREMIDLFFEDDEPAEKLADDPAAQIPEGHTAPLDDRTTAEIMAERDAPHLSRRLADGTPSD
jgi:hypothetical protein